MTKRRELYALLVGAALLAGGLSVAVAQPDIDLDARGGITEWECVPIGSGWCASCMLVIPPMGDPINGPSYYCTMPGQHTCECKKTNYPPDTCDHGGIVNCGLRVDCPNNNCFPPCSPPNDECISDICSGSGPCQGP